MDLAVLLLQWITHFPSHLGNFELCWFRGFSPQGRYTSTKEHKEGSIELKEETATGLFWTSYATEPTDRKRAYSTGWSDWILDLCNQGKLGCYYTMVCLKPRDTLVCLILLPCPVINVNGKLQQLREVRTIENPSGMKLCITRSKNHLRSWLSTGKIGCVYLKKEPYIS